MEDSAAAAERAIRTATTTVIRPRMPVDLRRSLGPLVRSRLTVRVDRDGRWWRATRSPTGPVTMCIAGSRDGIVVHAWGPGADWALETAPELVGARDSLDGFDPPPGIVRDLHRRMLGLRISRSHAVFEALVPTVLAQKVTGLEAGRAWNGLVRGYGEAAPAAGVGSGPPSPVRLSPSPSVLAALPYHAFHPLGVEMRRANVIRGLAARADRLERAADMPHADARRFLTAFPGIGPWTAAEVAIVALGDPDAVSVGDFHLPDTVAWALAGEPRGTDERMLELLEPFAGHRGRVIRLIEAAGIHAPRYGPKATVRSISRR